MRATSRFAWMVVADRAAGHRASDQDELPG
jgi:hypothetical protein